jgi:hypothetical protein
VEYQLFQEWKCCPVEKLFNYIAFQQWSVVLSIRLPRAAWLLHAAAFLIRFFVLGNRGSNRQSSFSTAPAAKAKDKEQQPERPVAKESRVLPTLK